MSLRNLIFGLSASFAVAWLSIVVVPFFKMHNLAPVQFDEAEDNQTGVFYPKRSGRVADGARVYAANGCYQCHSQLIRPTYAGNDLFREGWAGVKDDADRGDTRRETNAFDYAYESFAQIGVMRFGPDLSNIGRRVETMYAPKGDASQWLYKYLYNPRTEVNNRKSLCPSFPFLFEAKPLVGNVSDHAVATSPDGKMQYFPSADAQALVSYLLAMKKDQPVPAVLNFAPKKAE